MKKLIISVTLLMSLVSSIILVIILIFTLSFGYIRCVYKTINCNWDPIGKAEIIYTVGTFTSLGVVIGYFDIDDK